MRVLNSKFLSEKGESLSVRLTLPRDKMPVHFAMIAHCFTCNKDFNNVRNISKAMTASGFGVLSLDFTGLGSSNGNFADTNFSTNVDDLVAAANYLKKKYVSPSLIIGHSFGGPAAIYAADKIPSVKAVATIAAPSQVDHVKHLLGDEIDVIKEEGKGTASISGNSITIKKQFLHDIDQHNLTEVEENLGNQY